MTKLLWTQKQDVGPAARVDSAMAYHPARQRIVLFGGNSLRGLLGDTWEWDGEDWTQVADTGPSPRAGHGLASDSQRSRLVLFGGRGEGDALNGDTWEWDGEYWTQVAETGPSPRGGSELAFDSQRSRIVLFGGEAAGGELRGDTWEWDGESWTERQDIGPSARSHPALAYDGGRERVVLFGGNAGGTAAGDTWEWDGENWKQLADFGPSPCIASAMVFDGSEALLVGGIDSLDSTNQSPRLFGATWVWNDEQWTQRQDIGPAPRWGHSAAFDSGRGRVVLFGGASAGPGDPAAADRLLGDTWETPGSATSGSPGSPGLQLKTFTLDPETVHPNETTTMSVTLSDAAPVNGVEVEIELGDQVVRRITIPAGRVAGQTTLTWDINFGAGDILLVARLGDSLLAATLKVVAPA